jgi:hypothetical protein
LITALALAQATPAQIHKFGSIEAGGYGRAGGPVVQAGVTAADAIGSFGSAAWQWKGAMAGASFGRGGISPYGGVQITPLAKLAPMALAVYGGVTSAYDPFGAILAESRRLQWKGFTPSGGVRVDYAAGRAAFMPLVQARRGFWQNLAGMSFEAGLGRRGYLSGSLYFKLGGLAQALNGS